MCAARTREGANIGFASRIPRAIALAAFVAWVPSAVFAGSDVPAHTGVLAQSATAPPAPTAGAADHARRPKIGLVLSGGGARGITHVGVLKVLEELRVPVDFISATSMGAIVGGLYAAGVSADKLETLVVSIDWPAMFSDQPPRRELTVRRKIEEATYTVPLEVGFRDFDFHLARGALTGQNLERVLHGLTWRDDDVGSFDRLPIPFRAVATSMVDGKEVVFDRGPLYLAMRGSMSVPGVFAPVEVDGKLLGDGGLVKNLPVDLVKAMGADVVIAVNIGTPLLTHEQLSSFVRLAEQSINILTEQNVRAQLALLRPGDVLIAPDLGELSALDFIRGTRFIELGEKAARAAADSLRRYALPPAAYAAYRESLQRPAKAPNPELTFAGVRGTDRTNPEVLQAQAGLAPGERVDLESAESAIAVLFGRGDFERIGFRLLEEAKGGREIAFVVSEKSWGPNFLQFGAGLASDFKGENSFGLRVGHKRTWLNDLGGEWVNDVVLGTTTSYTTELYQPLSREQTWFASVSGSIGSNLDYLFVDQSSVADYRVLDERAAADLGYAFGTWGALRVGPVYQHQRASPTVAAPGFPVVKNDLWGVGALARIDTWDNAFFPSQGLRLTLSAFTGKQRLDDVDYDATRVQFDANQAIPLGERDTLNLGLRVAGTNVSGSPFTNYRLGGFLEVSGLRTTELQGPYLGRARAVWLHRMGRLPAIGNTYYLGGSLEAGNVWASRDAISVSDVFKAGSVFVAADTLFGPLYLAWGLSTGGNSTWYILLGRP